MVTDDTGLCFECAHDLLLITGLSQQLNPWSIVYSRGIHLQLKEVQRKNILSCPHHSWAYILFHIGILPFCFSLMPPSQSIHDTMTLSGKDYQCMSVSITAVKLFLHSFLCIFDSFTVCLSLGPSCIFCISNTRARAYVCCHKGKESDAS